VLVTACLGRSVDYLPFAIDFLFMQQAACHAAAVANWITEIPWQLS